MTHELLHELLHEFLKGVNCEVYLNDTRVIQSATLKAALTQTCFHDGCQAVKGYYLSQTHLFLLRSELIIS